MRRNIRQYVSFPLFQAGVERIGGMELNITQIDHNGVPKECVLAFSVPVTLDGGEPHGEEKYGVILRMVKTDHVIPGQVAVDLMATRVIRTDKFRAVILASPEETNLEISTMNGQPTLYVNDEPVNVFATEDEALVAMEGYQNRYERPSANSVLEVCRAKLDDILSVPVDWACSTETNEWTIEGREEVAN